MCAKRAIVRFSVSMRMKHAYSPLGFILMPRTTIRPSLQEVQAIRDQFVERRLPDETHRRLRIVLAWATGSTVRQVAAKKDLACSRETVRRLVKLYAKLGLDGFSRAGAMPRGRRPVPTETDAAIAADLRQAMEAGRPVTYRAIAKKHEVSFNHVAKVAMARKLDPKNRRGQVAGAAP